MAPPPSSRVLARRPRDHEGAEEVHLHLLSSTLDPLRISEFATEEADDARVVDQEVHVRRGRGGGGNLRGVGDIQLQRRDAWAVAGHERVEGREAAGGGVHLLTPAATSASTMASPMPRLAPVTSAVLPESA